MLEFAQQLVTIAEGLFRRTYFEPALIASFGLTLILSARVISRITSFLTLRETEHVPETRTESVVEIRLGEVHSGTLGDVCLGLLAGPCCWSYLVERRLTRRTFCYQLSSRFVLVPVRCFAFPN